ncbi:hypothetical protein BJY04DRAFT_217210 [Aspergillus karnatakaensis]|uniref:uncharacterized protein n=1 Tax=Aspergillus karnatakaensis TaxID=1810916 RepID=UPI003CCCD717
MASGLEVVGVSIAVLALVVNQLDNYAQGFHKLGLWKNAKGVLTDLALGLATQERIFINHIEHALESTTLDTRQISQLVKVPVGGGWNDPDLKRRLQSTFEKQYEVFIRNVRYIYKCLRELSAALKIDIRTDVYALSEEGKKQAKTQVRTWRIIFVSVYTDQLAKINSANGILGTLVEQSTRRSGMRRVMRWGQTLSRLREARKHADGVYKAVTTGGYWGCKCSDQHRAHLKLFPHPINFEGTIVKQECVLTLLLSGTNVVDADNPWRSREVDFVGFNRGVAETARASGMSSRQKSAGDNMDSPISDMCSSLAGIQDVTKTQVIGYLPGLNAESRYVMRTMELSQRAIPQKSLREKLSQTSGRDRLRIATGLACAVMQLHGNWLIPFWDSWDLNVTFASDGPYPTINGLYYTYPFSLRSAQQDHTASSLLSLPQIRNHILFPLALVLIELSLRKTVRELQIPQDFASDSIVTEFNTASRVLSRVYAENGEGYGNVVHSCLFWSGMEPVDFGDVEFEKRVFEAVVCPLLQDLSYFEGRRELSFK